MKAAAHQKTCSSELHDDTLKAQVVPIQFHFAPSIATKFHAVRDKLFFLNEVKACFLLYFFFLLNHTEVATSLWPLVTISIIAACFYAQHLLLRGCLRENWTVPQTYFRPLKWPSWTTRRTFCTSLLERALGAATSTILEHMSTMDL